MSNLTTADMPEKQKIRIAYYSEGWGIGGIERFLMNVMKQLDPSAYEITVFNTHEWNDINDAELDALGAEHVVLYSGKPSLVARTVNGAKAWSTLLRNKKFDVVHINVMNGVGFLYAHVARRRGIPVRIVHSHNSDYGVGSRTVKGLMHELGKRLWGKDATVRLACSQIAGKYLFGERPFEVIPNGIDTESFRFNKKQRDCVRDSLAIRDDELLFGAVGRLEPAKNPLFQVDILESLRREGIEAKLLLVGGGSLVDETKRYAKEKGLDDYLIMPAATSSPAEYYWALDVFTMPSIFDGFGITALEAMASGLPCLRSDAMPALDIDYPLECQLSPNNAERWAKKVLDFNEQSKAFRREDLLKRVQSAEYDYTAVPKRLFRYYREETR